MSIDKVKTLDEILAIRLRLRKAGNKLVFTNGCFDLLHVGHVRYLVRARELGDCLVVAVNSDRSMRVLKGAARPVVAELERAEILAALECVDYVVIFDDHTPQDIIAAIVPDVLVKGADWGSNEIVGRETVEGAGGSVRTVPLVEGASTSSLIARIRERFGSDQGY